jgi:5'-phosphate synthase pdxT subunit
MRIGVLGVQGAIAEHEAMLATLGTEAVRVRLPADLEGLSGLILPGGETTTMRKLIHRWGLHEPILELARKGTPILGTCAGMILLASEITDGDAPVFALLDISVKRNAFGRQLQSFEADVTVPALGDAPVHGVFIRAPIVERVGGGVDVLARLDDGRVVAVRQGHLVATAFHPELAGEPRFHHLLTSMATAHEAAPEGDRHAPVPIPRDRQDSTS